MTKTYMDIMRAWAKEKGIELSQAFICQALEKVQESMTQEEFVSLLNGLAL